MATLPDSYATVSLPALRLQHHPDTSPTVTPIIVLELHRPHAKNAFNTELISSLETAIKLLSTDPRVKCIVLTSSDPSNRTFCAGMDLSPQQQQQTPNDTRTTHRDGGGRVALALFHSPKPIIAALNGAAVGVGITMTLPCAIRVTHRAAKIGFVFARRGLVCEACSSFFLPRLLGASRAMHLLTAGSVLRADDPLLDGLCTLVDEPRQVRERALAIAEDVVRNCSVVSTVVMRDLVFRGPGSPEKAHLLESRVLWDLFRGRDFAEGVGSFVEKREPKMVGTVEEDAPAVWPWWEDALKGWQAKL